MNDGGARALAEFDEAAAEAQKKRLLRAIKPVSGRQALPPRIGPTKRVLLIVPPSTAEEHVGRLSGASGELPMLGLGFIAAALRDQGHDVRIIDYEVNGWSMSRVADDVRAFRPDLVGMTAYITNMRRCGTVAAIVKKVDPRCTVILGGPQVTIFPDEAFVCPDVDMIALSEGEIIIRNVMNALGSEEKLTHVNGIWYRSSSGEIVKNPREDLVDNLDIFPEPALDLFEMHKYFPPVYIRGKRVAHLLTSRGCPFQCTFCETKLTFGRSFRYHSTERVIRELGALVEAGYDSFQFYDDIFTANKPRVEELCRAIIAKGWKIQWMCYTRTNTVSPQILKLMRQAGCYMISYGVESADNELLDIIKKNVSAEAQIKGIQMTKAAGIQVTATFMLGLPTETREQSEATLRFALENGIDYGIFGLTEPYPGTELWVDAQKYGYFDSTGRYRNNLLSEHAAVWIPHGRTREELKAFVEKCMWKFYFRRKTISTMTVNLLNMPLSRWMRFFWAGFVFFILGRLRQSRVSHMASRN
jgi:anaerobic magnesium-protoporphyrin IX monomethyl ester cyclase